MGNIFNELIKLFTIIFTPNYFRYVNINSYLCVVKYLKKILIFDHYLFTSCREKY